MIPDAVMVADETRLEIDASLSDEATSNFLHFQSRRVHLPQPPQKRVNTTQQAWRGQ